MQGFNMRVSLLALALLAGASLASAARPLPATPDVKPWFCHENECPGYTVVRSTPDYEVRDYDAGVWASTDVEAYAYAIASGTGFRRLFNYIDGGNAGSLKINMTSPVRSQLSAAAGPFCKRNFTVSFYVPKALQASPPAPLSPDVYISQQAPFRAYVTQGSGYKMDDYSIARMAKGLAESLDSEGLPYDGDTFFYASYDPPFRFTGRHNEVWFTAEEGPARTSQQ